MSVTETPESTPWRHFTSPIDKWATQPSFVIGEYLFIACAAIALFHAWKHDRRHVLLWVCALVAGTANDLIFMALPMVDNFWQAQATVMLTARMPLYIPCVYVCFMYYPTVAVWRLGLRPLPRAMLTGLLAMVFYAPYDIVGAKFLWWTWHDTDKPIAHRLFGAPVGSTMWIITFVAAFAYLSSRVMDRDPAIKPKTIALTIAIVAGLSSIAMVLQMTVLQQLDGGFPGVRGLVVVIAIYALVVWRGFRSRVPPPPRKNTDRLLQATVIVYFLTLTSIMALFKPETHISTSMHQTYGACHVEAKDITGATRYEFLCAEDYDEDFTFACVPTLPSPGTRWYTVCGRPHRHFLDWMIAITTLSAVGIGVFNYLLGKNRHSPKPEATMQKAA